jgi:hypothetical protein
MKALENLQSPRLLALQQQLQRGNGLHLFGKRLKHKAHHSLNFKRMDTIW